MNTFSKYVFQIKYLTLSLTKTTFCKCHPNLLALFDPYFCHRASDNGALGELCDQLLPNTVCCAVTIQWSFTLALNILNARDNKREKTAQQLKMLVRTE